MRWTSLVLTTAIFGGMWSQVQSIVKNHPVEPGQNHPPKVSIITPKNHLNLQPGQQVFYSIEVVDTEDGDSRYAEIVPNEVFIDVWFFPSEQEMVNSEGQSNAGEDILGLKMIKESGCFNCHDSKTALVGPAFYKIARKYQQQDIDEIVGSVLNGSSGNWSSASMPAQVDITEIEARQAVQWILANGGNDHRTIYAGINGSFKIPPEVTMVVCVLKASYTDHGVDGNQQSRLSGSDRVVLHIQ
jgi:cytochrome c551/c552